MCEVPLGPMEYISAVAASRPHKHPVGVLPLGSMEHLLQRCMGSKPIQLNMVLLVSGSYGPYWYQL